MKKSLAALLLITSFNSFAEKIPASIENVIAGTNAREHSLKNGELTVRYDRSRVTPEMASSMFDWICNDYFMNKWKPETIKKITLLNVGRDQGIKINAGGDECKKTGSMDSAQEQAFKARIIESATQL